MPARARTRIASPIRGREDRTWPRRQPRLCSRRPAWKAERRGRWPTGSARSGSPTWSARTICSGPSGAITRMLDAGLARLDDLLGAARHRQDHRRAAARRRDRPRLRADFRGLFGGRRPQEGLRRRPLPPRGGAGDAPLRRRDPPLQPRPAGLLPPGHGGRHRDAGRRDHGEPVLRAQRRASVARPRPRLPPARRRGDRPAPRPRRGRGGAGAAARRRRPRHADRHGRPRRPRRADAGRGGVARGARGRGVRAGGTAGDPPAPRADLRQGPGRPLQPDLGPPQVGARLRPRRRALLPRPHARRRRAAALHRPPPGADGDGGYRPRRPAGAGGGARRQGHLRLSRLARGRTGAGRGRRLSRHRAEVERGLHRLQGGDRGGEGGRVAGAAEDHPQCADRPDAEGRLRLGLPLRPRRARRLLRPGLFPRGPRPPDLLRPAGARLRARDQEAARLLGQAPEGAGGT